MTPNDMESRTVLLGIETSCDETAAAVLCREPAGAVGVLSSVVSSQIDLHARFGGVVPEVAWRAHIEHLNPVIGQALLEAGVEHGVDAVAATAGPGLVGSLLVGVSAAKALALVWSVPYVAVNHLEAHLFAPLLEEPEVTFPLLVALVSGGHTILIGMHGPGRYRLLGPHAGRRRRRGLRQGGALSGPGLPRRPCHRRSRHPRRRLRHRLSSVDATMTGWTFPSQVSRRPSSTM